MSRYSRISTLSQVHRKFLNFGDLPLLNGEPGLFKYKHSAIFSFGTCIPAAETSSQQKAVGFRFASHCHRSRIQRKLPYSQEHRTLLHEVERLALTKNRRKIEAKALHCQARSPTSFQGRMLLSASLCIFRKEGRIARSSGKTHLRGNKCLQILCLVCRLLGIHLGRSSCWNNENDCVVKLLKFSSEGFLAQTFAMPNCRFQVRMIGRHRSHR